MANYIDKEIICEAYVHLNVDESLGVHEIEEIKRKLKHFFDERVKFLLGESVETDIETADGSLKVTLTAFAGIVSLLGGAVLKYPEFRDSVKAIYEDSRMLAEATNLETVFVTRTPSCDRLRTEARTGVIGRAAKLLTAIDTLKSRVDNFDAPSSRMEVQAIEQASNSIGRLDQEARKILEKVSNDADRFCLAKGIHEAFNQLPEVMPAEQKLNNSPIFKAALKEKQVDLLAESVFQRYTASVKSIKDFLKRAGVASLPKKA